MSKIDLPIMVTVKLPNGRWSHVYADDMPQAGMRVPGGHEYDSKEVADEAGHDRSDTVGQCRGMFDRFLLPQEPPPVEWQEDGEHSDHDVTDMPEGKRLVAELSKISGMLTKLLEALKGAKAPKDE